jgi:hypothetical protein
VAPFSRETVIHKEHEHTHGNAAPDTEIVRETIVEKLKGPTTVPLGGSKAGYVPTHVAPISEVPPSVDPTSNHVHFAPSVVKETVTEVSCPRFLSLLVD